MPVEQLPGLLKGAVELPAFFQKLGVFQRSGGMVEGGCKGETAFRGLQIALLFIDQTKIAGDVPGNDVLGQQVG
ncbi:MAG: hypothetical protein BWX83_01256 [Candidatus Cloacimonetes bacterium ADurb.Bin117]|nr:MAG: hypothetical protein BWX83_01256 [Candidatus Cloacimonetes bacterium ADurb.Bin117]